MHVSVRDNQALLLRAAQGDLLTAPGPPRDRLFVMPVFGSAPPVIDARPMSIWKILGGAITFLRRYPGIVFGLAALITFATTAAHALIGLLAAHLFERTGPDVAGSDVAPLEWLHEIAGWLREWGAVLGLLGSVDGMLDPFATLVLAGLLVTIVLRSIFRWPSTITEAWRVLRPRLLQLLIAGALIGTTSIVLFYVAIFFVSSWLVRASDGGTLEPDEFSSGIVVLSILLPIFIVAGIILALLQIWLTTLTPVIVTEKEDALSAVVRTSRLLKDNWLRTLGLVALTFLLGVAVELTLGCVPWIGEYLAAVVNNSFVATVTTLIFFDLKLRKEWYFEASFFELIGVPVGHPEPGTGHARPDPLHE